MPPQKNKSQFLLNIQRLLGEGMCTATYKYALLLALLICPWNWGMTRVKH